MSDFGYAIVCPDGETRGLPYVNEGDARFDAQLAKEQGCSCSGAYLGCSSPCPQGDHTVRRILLMSLEVN